MSDNEGLQPNIPANQVFEILEPVRELFRGRMFRFTAQQVRVAEHSVREFECAERSPGVRVLVSDGTHLLLTKEWRVELNEWDYRLPGGKAFESLEDYLSFANLSSVELHKGIIQAAQRELKEETGVELAESAFEVLHISHCGATVIWDLYYLKAELSMRPTEKAWIRSSEGETMFPQWIERSQVKEFCLSGKIMEDRTVAVLLRYLFPQ